MLSQSMDYQEILSEITAEIEPLRGVGRQADYIPALAKVNPDRFGVFLTTTDGKEIGLGDVDEPFSIQSLVGHGVVAHGRGAVGACG